MNNEAKAKKQTKQPKPEKPGNDVLNGIERWIPDGTDKPSQFKYESPNHIWYRDKWEAATCLARAGIPEDKWCAKLENPFAGCEGAGE